MQKKKVEENFHRRGRRRGGSGGEEEEEKVEEEKTKGGPVRNFFLYRPSFSPLLWNEREALCNGSDAKTEAVVQKVVPPQPQLRLHREQ